MKSSASADKYSDSAHHLLRAISKAQSEFITNTDPRDLFDRLLSNLLAITRSEYGFIGEVFYEPDHTVYLKTHAISNIAWDAETRKFYEENSPRGLEFRNLNSLFGAVLRRAETVISNDPDNDPRSGGRPPGHPPLKAFLGLPFFSGKEFIGMVGIANRPGGYDEELVTFLNPFLSTCGNIIQAFRNDRLRMQAEKSLRESLIKNRTILETVASGIVTMDAQRLIRDFNAAAERIFGYSAQEVIGRNVNMLMPEPFHSQHDHYVQQYLKTGKKRVIGIGREVRGKRRDGSVFPMELAVNEMIIGEEHMFVASLTDISLRKQSEESLMAAKEAAEQANRVKSDFINTVSHELRTPLTVILGNIPLLTDPDMLPDAKEISEIAKDIEEDGQHLLRLINDLLDVSRIEAGKIRVYAGPVSLSEILEEVLPTIRRMAMQKELEIDTEISEMELCADPLRLRQIFFNILSNAVKFTDKGKVTLRGYTHRGMGYFETEDTGCGMDEKDLSAVFRMFHQADSSSTRKASGTGLGLTISKKFVEMQGGEIWVKSRIGEGSVFTFTIPLTRKSGEEGKAVNHDRS